MNYLKLAITAWIGVMSLPAYAQPNGYVFVGGDEFNGTQIDFNKWHLPPARTRYGNFEFQYYTDSGNFSIGNGFLRMIAKKETITANVVPTFPDSFEFKDGNGLPYVPPYYNHQTFAFTSGELDTKQKYKYGYFEARVRFDQTKGTWPAFWMFGTTNAQDPEEIDIGEWKGEKPHEVSIDFHPDPQNPKKSVGGWIDLSNGLVHYSGQTSGIIDFTQHFTRISMLWKHPDLMQWYVEGKPIGWYKYRMDYQKEVLLNLAVASYLSPFAPQPDANTPFPSNFDIDYVRYYYPMDCSQWLELRDYIQDMNMPSVETAGTILTGSNATDIANGQLHSCFLLKNAVHFPYGQYLQLIAADQIILNPNTLIEAGSTFSAKITPCGQVSSQGYNQDDPLDLISSDSLMMACDTNLVPHLQEEEEGGGGDSFQGGKTNKNLKHQTEGYFNLYPNPSDGAFDIGSDDPLMRFNLRIFDAKGMLIFNQIYQSNARIDLRQRLPKGLYYAVLSMGDDGTTETFKVLIQ